MSPCVDIWFSVIVKECDDICHLRRNECLEFIVILLCLSVLVESLVWEKFSPERLIYFWSLIIMILQSSICFIFLIDRVTRSDWISPCIPPRLGTCSCRSLDKFSRLRFHEHGCWQPCKTEVPWNILHRCH